MAGEVASLRISPFAVPVLDYLVFRNSPIS